MTVKEILKPGFRVLGVIFLISGAINLLILFSSVYMLQVFDRVLTSGSLETLGALTFLLVVALGCYGGLELVRSRLFNRFGSWVTNQFGPPVLHASLAAQRKGVQLSAGFNDVARLQSFFGGQGIQPLFDAPWVPLFLITIFLLHPVLGLAAIIAAILLGTVAVCNEWVTRDSQLRAGRHSSSANNEVNLALRNFEVIHAMALERSIEQRWRQGMKLATSETIRTGNRSSWFIGSSRFVRLLAQSSMIGLGAFLVLEGQLTAGGMIAASILLGRGLAPVEQAIGSWRSVVNARESSQKLDQLFKVMDAASDSQPLPVFKGRISVEGVTVYPPGAINQASIPILRNVSFALEPGDVLGVVGPSASGKSSLSRVLVGAWDPFRGAVRADGAKIRHWDRATLCRDIGYLPQQSDLFNGTITENIARMEENPDNQAVLEAAEIAGVHKMIINFKEGYNTQIGENGSNLSQGQRQRIALARAVYRNPKFIVLDEPNANLDSAGEIALVQAILTMRKKGSTIVIVTHRTQILSHVTKILVMAEGKVERFGEQKDFLAEFVARQKTNKSKNKGPSPADAARNIKTSAQKGARDVIGRRPKKELIPDG